MRIAMNNNDNACDILGPVSIVVQTLLGILALTSLLYKRSREYPIRRPWKIWLFDVSKQVFGAFGTHCLNLLMSIISGGSTYSVIFFGQVPGQVPGQDDPLDDPCNYYFLNILFDTTIGVPILYVCLLLLYNIADHLLHLKGVKSGEYGNPPLWRNYFKQLLIYTIGLIMMKFIIYLALIYFPFLLSIADWLLSIFNKNENMQIIFVVMVFPLLMNSLQYYLVDNIIQSPEYKNLHHTQGHGQGHGPDIENTTRPDKGLLGQSQPEQPEGVVEYGSI